MSQGNFHAKRVAAVTRQLAKQGIVNPRQVILDATTAQLYEEIVRRGEAQIVHGGPVAVLTGIYTGRSANDKFVVKDGSSQKHVAWGKVNRPYEGDYARLKQRMMAFLQGRDLFVQDCRVGADPAHQRKVRILTMWAWQSLFARNMFIHPRGFDNDKVDLPNYTVIAAPGFKADPSIDSTRSEAFIVLNLKEREVLIGGTGYGGEIKKSIFTVMNYLLPLEGVLPMHCSANIGEKGDTAIFFGLSGTGKTTLSTDSRRKMIGDDEHGWSDRGVFNFEGGCYAKVIRLSPSAEPEIWANTRKFGTVMENVVMDPVSRRVDLDSEAITENTRACYPLSSLDNVQEDGLGNHPEHVIMLTADAFGILPPVSRLTPEQAMFHFLSGYTAKLAGTERGVKDPQATFSTCFGAPFMVHDPVVYGEMLRDKLAKTHAKCWLVNTGWTGGAYGEGYRMPILETRAIINGILSGALDKAETRLDGVFGLHVPKAVADVDPVRLDPRKTWKNVKAFDEKAKHLAGQFADNFAQYAPRVAEEVRACAGR
ncbi:MAG: phosphoenolpyruvate carboxykinase (ATP) [Magnetococcales bacterium]|nr:phosphoenolpyruvate carboxykinase (ATP) [Magnetococcales bacterium]